MVNENKGGIIRVEHLRKNNLRLFHVYSPKGRIFAPLLCAKGALEPWFP